MPPGPCDGGLAERCVGEKVGDDGEEKLRPLPEEEVVTSGNDDTTSDDGRK